MSHQAYLDAIEKKNIKTPEELPGEAPRVGSLRRARRAISRSGSRTTTTSGGGMRWALFGVLKNGLTISDKHVDSGTAHSDASTELRLDGIDLRNAALHPPQAA